LHTAFLLTRALIQPVIGQTAFHLARRAYLRLQHHRGSVYDPDYLFVSSLASDCTLVDVGANGGQSALCFARLRADAQIISFEANPDNLHDLERTRSLVGDRFTYHPVALSDRNGCGILRVPVVGRTLVPGEASLSRSFLGDAATQDRIGRISRVVEHRVALRTMDSFDLHPDLVKIDVQGHELAVLRGMVQTLARHRPVLLIEVGPEFEDVGRFLDEHGYRLFSYDSAANRLLPDRDLAGPNVFAVARERG
jgi:FkbM family methyltransferase